MFHPGNANKAEIRIIVVKLNTSGTIPGNCAFSNIHPLLWVVLDRWSLHLSLGITVNVGWWMFGEIHSRIELWAATIVRWQIGRKRKPVQINQALVDKAKYYEDCKGPIYCFQVIVPGHELRKRCITSQSWIGCCRFIGPNLYMANDQFS